MSVKIEKLVKEKGRLYSEILGIKLGPGRPKDTFKWFLASLLFGKRISETIAMNTYKEFEKARVLTPQAIMKAGWDRLVEILDAGGYVRYDYSTADKLLEIADLLKERYGTLGNLHKEARNSRDLEKKLLDFRGIGPVTVNIFLRELRTVWKKADPTPSRLVRRGAKKMKINLKGMDRKTKKFMRLECALLRVGKERKK